MGDVSDGEARIPVLTAGAADPSAMPEPGVADAFVERFTIEGAADGPLRGASFAAKDLFDVAGRLKGCGNPTWRATHGAAVSHAAAVDLLLGAGARLAGKTCTDELAYSLDGRNDHTGAPLNAAAHERLTGGSSSGSAAAVSAGEVDFALATDTAGSVRVPAAWCGLIGLRPTHARISVAGLTPLAPSFDTIGWMARSMPLMRRVGAVFFGNRAAPEQSLSLIRDRDIERRAEALDAAALDSVFERCARQVSVREVPLGIDLEEAAQCLRVLQGYEAWHTHGAWIESARPHMGPAVAERFAIARAITADQVAKAAQAREALVARLEEALPPGRILGLPTVPGPAPRRDASPDHLQLTRTRLLPLTALASLSGRPQITLPLLDCDGAPVGFSLLGWRHGDEALLELAESWLLS